MTFGDRDEGELGGVTLHDIVSYYSIYKRYTRVHGSRGIGIGLLERFSVRIFASLRTDMSRTLSPSVTD